MKPKLLPHAVTLALASLLILSQQIWASPIVERLASAVEASSRTTINYQGYLTDSSGTPVDGTVDIAFRMYNVSSGGTPLWTETQPGIAVTEGLFSVSLGSVLPLNQALFVQNGDLWLGIAVGSDSEMTPREKLGSAPYAFSSDVPDGGITTSKLADNAVTSAKIQDGQIGSFDIANGSVTRIKTTILTFRSGFVNIAQGSNYTFSFTHNLGHTNYTAVCTGEDVGNHGRHLRGGTQGNTSSTISFAVFNTGDDGTLAVRAHCVVIPD